MSQFIVYVLLCACTVTVFTKGTEIHAVENLSTDLSSLILTFLEAPDLEKFSLTSKHNLVLLRDYASSPLESPSGQSLRKSSFFNIKLENGKFLHLQEYLEKEEWAPISRIANPVELAKKHPNIFLQIVLKAIPKNQKISFAQLKYYYQDVFKVGSMTGRLKAPKSPEESLANTLIELMSWMHIWWSQAKDTVLNQVWEEIGELIGKEADYQLKNELNSLIERRVRGEVRDNLWDQLWHKVGDQLDKYIWDTAFQIGRISLEPLKLDLSHFRFLLAYKQGNLTKAVKTAIDYAFMIYQIQNIVFRNTANYNKLHKNLSRHIKNTLTSRQTIKAMTSLNIPRKNPHFVVETHLHLMRIQASTVLKKRILRKDHSKHILAQPAD